VKISRDFAEKMALLPLKNERFAIKSLEILAPLFKSSNITSHTLHYSAESKKRRANSQMTMPAVTETFMECFVPN
jgi:hypothetical protein